MGAGAAKRNRQPSNRIAMVLSLIPGAGHYYLERYIMASLLFGGFITSLNGLFLGSTLQSGNPDTLKGVSMAGLVIVMLLSILLTYKQSYGTDRKSLAQNRGILLRAALVDYLRDDLEDSAKKLEQAIEMDVDWQDPDPLFHLGVVMLRLAERSAARALKESARSARRRSQWAFRTCLARDRQKKWRSEIARESKRMRRILSITGRLRAVTESGTRIPAATESGSFPELQASGSFQRLSREALTGDSNSKLKSGAIVRGLSATPPEGLSRDALSELGAELEAASAGTPPQGTPTDPPKRKSSPYLPPPTRSYARPDPAELRRLAQAETLSLEGGKQDVADVIEARELETMPAKSADALPDATPVPKPTRRDVQELIESSPHRMPPTNAYSHSKLAKVGVELEAKEAEPEAEAETEAEGDADEPVEEAQGEEETKAEVVVVVADPKSEEAPESESGESA